MPNTNSRQIAKLAFRFVLIIGIVNLFADMAYEGGRSISGPFLGSLGASATIVGFVAGFGELLGYSLRSVSGYFSDKTHRYWIFTFIGYVTNVLAVPALALAGNWPLAAALTLADLTKTNNEIALVVKTNGQPIKIYKMQFEAPAVRERRARKRRWRFVSSYSSSSFLPLRV